MGCCCGTTSSSSGSVSGCCRNCSRLQFGGAGISATCDGVMGVTIGPGNYRVYSNYENDCEIYETRPNQYGADGTTEDGRIVFEIKQRLSDGKRIVTAKIGCHSWDTDPFQDALTTATYVCDDCQCNGLGDYTLESSDGGGWPESISIVDQALLTQPSGPPATITITMPDCRSTYAPATFDLDLILNTDEGDGHLSAEWHAQISTNVFGTPTVNVYVAVGCGYIYVEFREMFAGIGTDLNPALEAFPSNGGDVTIYVCNGTGGSGALSGCPCPTTTIQLSW